MQKAIVFIIFSLSLSYCASTQTPEGKKQPVAEKEISNPILDEKMINEAGEETKSYSSDPEFFIRPSTDKKEYFRVIIKSDSYMIRQIRGTVSMTRKPDQGGDKLISEEVKKYDMIDFMDEGVIQVKINQKHGGIEELKFLYRAPRINNLAKIMQNDATRWNIEFKKEDEKITEFNIYYQVVLQNFSNREEVKEKLKKEVVR